MPRYIYTNNPSTTRYQIIDTGLEKGPHVSYSEIVIEAFTEEMAQKVCEALNYKPPISMDQIMRKASGETRDD